MRLARVTLASTPRDRFLRRIETIRVRIDRLPEDAVGQVLQELESLRRRVLGELAGAEGFPAVRLEALAGRIERVMGEFEARYGRAIAPFQEESVLLGRALIAQPIVEAGLTFGVPETPRRLVEAAQGFQADLIKGLSQDATRRVTQAIRLGALEGKSVFEVMGDVAGSLKRPGPFASIAARAEAITRTELLRLSSIAQDATLREAKALVPQLKKQWERSGNPRGRPTHQLPEPNGAHGQVREVEEFFEVRPAPGKSAEALLYPRDPRGSAANTVNCGCLSLPFKEDFPA